MSGSRIVPVLDDTDLALVGVLQDGLPLIERPYAAIAAALDLAEADVVGRIRRLLTYGVFKRFGVVVRHHELGYRANGMVVWDVPEQDLQRAGEAMAADPAVTLCYRRPRRPPQWPYNLYCMVHGRSRAQVLHRLEEMTARCNLSSYQREVLFSTRRFKQCGAHYRRSAPASAADGAGLEAAR